MNRIERLEKILNKTSGNPNHDKEGKFTFSPSSFKNITGKNAEVSDNPRDWYLTDSSRKNINKIPKISSTKELKDYLSSNGISSDIDNPEIKKHEDYENIEFDALKQQASGIVASVEFCKAVFGKESLSKLKEIKFYSSEAETTGSFDVMLKGEKPSKTNGTMELSTNITNRGILHEFIHVVQDSTKRKSQDSVLWSKEILDKTGANSKAYTGANKNHLAAEQLADLISFGIANGKNLEDVSKVINYIRKNKTENSIQLNGGPGSGNFNPGQGRGVGKPSKKISYEEYVEKFKKSTRSEKRELDEKYPEYADKYFDELMGRHLKVLKREREQKELEEKFKNYENDNSHPHFDLDNMVYEYKNALDITPDEYNGDWNDETKSFEKLKNLKEYYNKKKGIQVRIVSMNPTDYSRTIIDNDGEHYTSMSVVKDRTSKEGINMYKEKFKNGERVEIPYIKFDENGKFSGEQEGFHRTLAANEIGDSEIPVAIVTKYYGKQPKFSYGRDITKKVEKYFANKKENNSRLNRLVILENRINDRKSSGDNKLNKALNSQEENLDYRYDVKAYKEYLKEWLKHKDSKEWQEYGVLSFEDFYDYSIDYDFEDYDKIQEIIRKTKNKTENSILNGGPGSGNFNPGQGRGVGKPADGAHSSSSTKYISDGYLKKKDYEKIVEFTNSDNFTEEELEAITGYTKSMGYGGSVDLNKAIRENDYGEIVEEKNILCPDDDSQIITWKDAKEMIEHKIEQQKENDRLKEEIRFAVETLRSGTLGDAKENAKLESYIKELREKQSKLSDDIDYYNYEGYIESYKKGAYDNLKPDQKIWTIDDKKIPRVSTIELKEKVNSNSKKFNEFLEIPRLTWRAEKEKPTTTDTLANKFSRDFKDLAKLDNAIKNKGYTLDKDITVTRRVANIGVIKNQIQNKGEYTQNGITSTTAAKSIVQKMPSGVHMGNDLIRITIPAGTRVISTFKPFEADVYKSAEKYNKGKLTSDDLRNLKMIRNQNELILPSGSKFVSPSGNTLSRNEDGSYQLILKVEGGKMSNNRIERLNFLENIFNNSGKGNPYHDKFGRFASSGSSTSSSTLYYDSDTVLGDKSKSGDITKNIKSFKDFKTRLDKVKESYNGYLIEGQELWISPESKLFKKTDSPVTDKNTLKKRKEEIEKENKSPFVLVSTYNNKDVIIDGNHVAAAYRELSEEGKNYLVPILYVEREEIERFERENPNYHEGKKVYTKTKLIDEK